ncbi:hypothetical protein ACJMK2_034329 [Sinanodonta woodiana]|uniref:Uncharacterized protein n=1 Tax=Sinanodonta woodiana TaxID=1069815 RepID=A0ABD3WR76_SINWO
MKSFVVFAVVITVVSVQGSSIVMFRQILDNALKSEANRVRTMSKNILTMADDSTFPGNNDDDSSSIVRDSGEIMSGNIQEELQNIETLENIIRILLDEKELLDCQSNTCKLCCFGCNCMEHQIIQYDLAYQAGSKQFEVSIMYNSVILFRMNLPAKDYQICKDISFVFRKGTVYLKISNVRITESQDCLDLTISVLAWSNTFSNLCIKE